MKHLCIGSYVRIMTSCAIRAERRFDSFCEKIMLSLCPVGTTAFSYTSADEYEVTYAYTNFNKIHSSRQNLPTEIMQMALNKDARDIERYFIDVIIPVMDEARKKNAVLALKDVILHDTEYIHDTTQLGTIGHFTRKELESKSEFVKYYSPYEDIDDTEENIEKAAEHAQTDGRLKILYRFRNYLEIVASHYTLDEESSERLMLKYYDYLLDMKNLLYRDFRVIILHNLNKFPLNLDTALQEYYSKISDKINQYDTVLIGDGEKYYIQKLKPFYVRGRKYYEVTFAPAKDTENKTGRVIAFTKLPVISNYASRFQLVNEKIEILGKTMPILLVVGWEVSIRACEFKNLSGIVTGNKGFKLDSRQLI